MVRTSSLVWITRKPKNRGLGTITFGVNGVTLRKRMAPKPLVLHYGLSFSASWNKRFPWLTRLLTQNTKTTCIFEWSWSTKTPYFFTWFYRMQWLCTQEMECQTNLQANEAIYVSTQLRLNVINGFKCIMASYCLSLNKRFLCLSHLHNPPRLLRMLKVILMSEVQARRSLDVFHPDSTKCNGCRIQEMQSHTNQQAMRSLMYLSCMRHVCCSWHCMLWPFPCFVEQNFSHSPY